VKKTQKREEELGVMLGITAYLQTLKRLKNGEKKPEGGKNTKHGVNAQYIRQFLYWGGPQCREKNGTGGWEAMWILTNWKGPE